MSYILVKFDNDSTFLKTRNSGMIVSTGTGSTSWTYNVNKLTNQSVEDILRIIFETTGKQINFKGEFIFILITQNGSKKYTAPGPNHQHNLQFQTLLLFNRLQIVSIKT